MSEQPKFSFTSGSTSASSGGLFGATTSSSASGTSLFGTSSNSPATSGSLFGATASTSSASTPNLFGGTSTQSTSAPSQPSLFGASSAPGTSGAASSFTGFSTPNKTEASSGQGLGQTQNSIFGATTSSGGSGLFGGVGSTPASTSIGNTTPAQNKPFSFASISTTPAGPPPSGKQPATSLFSNPAKSTEHGKPGPTFGASAPPSSGQMQTLAPPSGSNPFGSFNVPSSGSGNLFNSSKPDDKSGLASTPQASTGQTSSKPTAVGSTNLFSTLNQGSPGSVQAQVEQSNSASLFNALGSQQTTSVPSTRASNLSLFGTTTSQTSTSTTSTNQQPLFSSTTTQAAPSKPPTTQASSSLFAPNTSKVNPSAQSTGQAAPSLFASTPAISAPASNLKFSLGGPTATAGSSQTLFSTSGGQSKTVESTATTATTGTSTTAPTSSAPLFASTTKAPEAPGSAENSSVSQPPAQAVIGVTTEDASKPTALGASTSGPKPTPQSRLKNKSMDEIITRWATDLTKYQKEFQAQAEKVAAWDRLLVDNSDKIMKLYGSTLEAERATTEVERQLSAVENDQAELEYWLDHYEKQVDEMTSSQVGSSDSLAGPDQERERTYKLAEKLSDRIDEMTKDLNSMVEEINEASSYLNKNSKPEDPLSQIVRVLNGHLSQLQQIDQGTAALQSKVVAAQKASRSFGAVTGNGFGNDSVNDFYRSYTRGR